jgi:hypothetical protein
MIVFKSSEHKAISVLLMYHSSKPFLDFLSLSSDFKVENIRENSNENDCISKFCSVIVQDIIAELLNTGHVGILITE